MKLFKSLFKKHFFEDKIKFFYDNPKMLVEIEFANRSDKKKTIFVEISCAEFEVDSQTEYRILTHDKFFRIEFDSDDFIVFYLQHSFGFKLFKRPVSEELYNPNEWILVQDTSEIN